MKILVSLFRWFFLYVIVGVLLAGLFWEENLNVSSLSHKIMAAGILLIFYFVINGWINQHDANFLVSSFDEPKEGEKKLYYHMDDDDHSGNSTL